MYSLVQEGIPKSTFPVLAGGPTFRTLISCNAQLSGKAIIQHLWLTCRADIQTCQNEGKVILLSLGGAVGTYGFSSSSQAQQFATTLWNLFGEGTGAENTRPFGSSVIDGFDLGTFLILNPLFETFSHIDIENQQPAYYTDFIAALRTLFATSPTGKTYYITGAPQ